MIPNIFSFMLFIFYSTLSVSFYYIGRRADIVRQFVVKEEISVMLRALALIGYMMGIFEAIISVALIAYYQLGVNPELLLSALQIVSVIVLTFTVIKLFNIYHDKPVSIVFDGLLVVLGALSIFSSAIDSGSVSQRILFVLFLMAVFIGLMGYLVPFLRTQLPNIGRPDPIEKASGFGAILVPISIVLAMIFFIYNRAYGSLFGPYAVLTQLFMALSVYGIYINLSPPEWLIRILDRGENN